MHHIFVSYARRDESLVTPIAECIERAGVPVWIDRRDIPVSLPWFDDVRYAINGADIVLVCASARSRESEACQLELMTAKQQGKRVVCIQLEQSMSTTAAAREVLAVHKSLDRSERVRTELLVRSADWQQAGRPGNRLQSGRTLRLMRRLARSPAHPLPTEAREFLEASRRRERRRRIMSTLGGSVLLGALLIYGGIRDAQKEYERKDASATATFVRATLSEETLRHDVYAAIRTTIPGVAHAPEGYIWRAQLMTALSTPVPDRSRLFGGAALRGFTTREVGDSPGLSTHAPGDLRVAHGRDEDGPLEARASGDSGIVEVTRRPGGSLYRRVEVGGPARVLEFNPDGRVLAAAVEGQVRLVDLQTGIVRATLDGSRGRIRALAWSHDGARVWAIAGQHRVVSWRWRNGTVLIDDPRVWFVAVSGPDVDGAIALIARDGSIRLTDPKRRDIVRTINTKTAPTLSGAMEHGGRLLALGSEGSLALVGVTNGYVRRIPLPGCTVTGVGFAPVAHTAYAACANGPLEFVDTATGRYERRLAIPMGGALSVAVAQVDGTIFVGTVFGTLIELGPHDLTPRAIHNNSDPASIWALAVTPDGKSVRTIGNGSAHLANAFSGRRSADGDWSWFGVLYPGVASDQGRALAVSPDGVLVASGLADGTIRLDTTSNITPGWTWTEMLGQIRGLAFTADGRDIVAATRTGLAELLPACPSCRPARAILDVARGRLARAHNLGLTDR